MPSTYTSNTGIEKPGSGEQSGTWGTTTNSNFDIIDQALHGQAQIVISGDQDLTTNDGLTSDGANTVLILTGSPGATFELRVTPTDQEKFYTIKNETNAACRIIYKGVTYSTSNGVEIAAGASQAVTGDGGGASGVFKSLTPNTDLVNDTTPQLGGTLNLNSNNITGTGNINISGTITSSGALSTGAITSGAITSGAINAGSSNITTTGTLSANAGSFSGTVGVRSLNMDDDIYMYAPDGNNYWRITVTASNDLEFYFGANRKIRFTSTGDLEVEDDITAFAGI